MAPSSLLARPSLVSPDGAAPLWLARAAALWRAHVGNPMARGRVVGGGGRIGVDGQIPATGRARDAAERDAARSPAAAAPRPRRAPAGAGGAAAGRAQPDRPDARTRQPAPRDLRGGPHSAVRAGRDLARLHRQRQGAAQRHRPAALGGRRRRARRARPRVQRAVAARAGGVLAPAERVLHVHEQREYGGRPAGVPQPVHQLGGRRDQRAAERPVTSRRGFQRPTGSCRSGGHRRRRSHPPLLPG